MPEPVRALYDRIAPAYEAHAADGFYNAHLDRPAVLDLCGDVAGLEVLDVGCGPGLYAQALVDRGAARLVAFDASTEMVRLAGARLGARAEVHHHDAGNPWTGWPTIRSTWWCARMVTLRSDGGSYFPRLQLNMRATYYGADY